MDKLDALKIVCEYFDIKYIEDNRDKIDTFKLFEEKLDYIRKELEDLLWTSSKIYEDHPNNKQKNKEDEYKDLLKLFNKMYDDKDENFNNHLNSFLMLVGMLSGFEMISKMLFLCSKNNIKNKFIDKLFDEDGETIYYSDEESHYSSIYSDSDNDIDEKGLFKDEIIEKNENNALNEKLSKKVYETQKNLLEKKLDIINCLNKAHNYHNKFLRAI